MATTIRTQVATETLIGASSPFGRAYQAPEETRRFSEPQVSALVLIAACDAFTIVSAAIIAAIFYKTPLHGNAVLHLLANRTAALPERFEWYADFALFFVLTAERLNLLTPRLSWHPGAGRAVLLQRAVWLGLVANALLLISTRYSDFHIIPVAVVAASTLILPARTLILSIARMPDAQPRNTVILGTNRAAKAIGDYISLHGELGHCVRGFVALPDALDVITGSRHSILGDLAALDEVVSTHFIDDIVLTEPCDPEYVNHLTGLARRLGVSLKVLACLHPADPEPRLLEYLGVHPVVQLYNRRPRGWRAGVKRLLMWCCPRCYWWLLRQF